MDEQQVTIARNYLHGASGELRLDKLPLRGAAQVLTTEDNTSGRPVYVADSANTATSMATPAPDSVGCDPGSSTARCPGGSGVLPMRRSPDIAITARSG